MRIDDRLAKQNQELLKKKKQQAEEDEDTLTYAQRKRMQPLNKTKSAFADNSGDGINTAKSIFDKTAIFHTGED